MRTILLAFALLNAILMYSSNILHGNISNEKQAIPFATVRLLNAGDSTYIQGCATDSVGYYRMEVDSVGQYLLSCSRMGYETRVLPVTIEEGKESRVDVTLAESAVALDEVTVEGETFVRSKDRLLITPNKQHVKHSGTGYDLLYNLMIPGVDVDKAKGKVSAFKGEVALYIDGVKASFREIRSLRPRDVERIEYFDAPTGKYADDNASINFITKKYTAGGYVSLDGKQMMGYTSGDYNAVAKMVHKSTSYTLFAGADFKNYRGGLRNMSDVIEFPGGDITRHYMTDDARLKNNSQYAQFNILNSNNRRTLKASLSFVRNETPENYLSEAIRYGGLRDTMTTSYSNIKQQGKQYGLNLYGNFKINDNQFLEIDLSGNYADNIYRYSYVESGNIATSTNENMYTTDASINYGITFNDKSSLSARFWNLHQITSSTYSGTTNSWQHLWADFSRFNVEYMRNLAKRSSLRLSAGMASLQYRLHGHDRASYIFPHANLVIVWQPNQSNFFQLRSSVGNSFPSLTMLNTAEQQVDFLQIRRGNPNLDATRAYNNTLVYSFTSKKLGIQLMGSYYLMNKLPVNSYFIEDNRLVQSYESNLDGHEIDANLSITWKPINRLNVKVDGMYAYIKFKGAISQAVHCGTANLQASYYIKDFALNAYCSTPTKIMGLDMIKKTIPVNYGITVSYARGNFRAEVGTNNPFMRSAEYKYRYVNDIYRYDNTVRSKTASQTAYVKLAYTIDFGKKTSRDKNNVNRTIDSAILKAN